MTLDALKFADRFDFDALRKRHRENFGRFVDFLHANGLRSAFDDGGSVRNGPAEDVFAEDVPCETMKPLRRASRVVRLWRNLQWHALVRWRAFRRRHPVGIPVG